MEKDLRLLNEVYNQLRLVANNFNHECDIDMHNLHQAQQSFERFMLDVRESEEYKKMERGE